ncbi:hypothetical protein UM91_12545 [Pseudomonas oryzihabitans]|nr:hypothetical protein UM91_12545 [Pseudomonas oryzihabitans]
MGLCHGVVVKRSSVPVVDGSFVTALRPASAPAPAQNPLVSPDGGQVPSRGLAFSTEAASLNRVTFLREPC